jgi:hypothetical protein
VNGRDYEGGRVDDVVEGIFRRLCDHQRAKGTEADMSLAELRLALGVTEAQLNEAVRVLRLSIDLFIAFTTPAWDRVTLGPSWQGRCEDEGRPTA